MKNKLHYIIITSCLLLGACRKDEIAIKPLDRGDVITSQVEMGIDYKTQLYYSLSENMVVCSNLKTDWDLAFECESNGYHLKLNSAKAMCALNTGEINFGNVLDTLGMKANEKVDSPTGNIDSTAVGDWRTQSPVYIISRGYNEVGTFQGFRKMQVLSVNPTEFIIKVAHLNGSSETVSHITKDPSKNYVNVSLASNSIVNIEPNKANYDLLFSQYTHVYYDPYSTYLVTGVISNPNAKLAAVFDKSFTDIDLSDTVTHPFGALQNTIGYYWKTYDFSTSSYTVNAGMNYIIKDSKGFFYKLHFIDFYNAQGQKGAPKFEFKKM